jgi:hypothetical protein
LDLSFLFLPQIDLNLAASTSLVAGVPLLPQHTPRSSIAAGLLDQACPRRFLSVPNSKPTTAKMGLPAALRSRLKFNNTEKNDPSSPASPTSKEQAVPDAEGTDNAAHKQATRMRRNFALSASFAYLLAWIFLVLVRHHPFTH